MVLMGMGMMPSLIGAFEGHNPAAVIVISVAMPVLLWVVPVASNSNRDRNTNYSDSSSDSSSNNSRDSDQLLVCIL